LWSRDPDLTGHPLGRNLELVYDGPQQLHELCSTSGRLADVTASVGVAWVVPIYFEVKVYG
jgi:hypothetical protein